MFWYLLFAHLLADYPLQPNWIVANKLNIRVLFLHVAIHFVVGTIIVALIDISLWPWVLVLALVHWTIDLGKNTFNRIYPGLVLSAYIIDQILHMITILGITIGIEARTGISTFSLKPGWLIFAIIYLATTFVWYISERIIFYREPGYRDRVVEYAWTRMFARAVFLTAMLLVSLWISPKPIFALALPVFPYPPNNQGIRALLTDVLVSLCGLILIRSIL